MAKKSKKSKKVTDKGAVELQETQLDEAQGAGIIIDQLQTTSDFTVKLPPADLSVRKAGGKPDPY